MTRAGKRSKAHARGKRSGWARGTSPQARSAGFTLVELLFVLALLGVVYTLALLPASMLAQQAAVRFATQDLLAGLQHARFVALTRATQVRVCPSRDGRACQAHIGWEQGWLVFCDANENDQYDADEALVLTHGAMPAGLYVRSRAPAMRALAFDAVGHSVAAHGAFLAGTLNVCSRSWTAQVAEQIVISRAGQVRVQRASGAVCTPPSG